MTDEEIEQDRVYQTRFLGVKVSEEELKLGRRIALQKVIAPNFLLDATQEFMEKGGQLDGPFDFGGFDVTSELRKLRRKLLNEEVREYREKGEFAENPVETLDGLLDIIVIAYGTALAYFGPDAVRQASAEVARSNLDKVDGPGLPIYREDKKIMKPEGWVPPDIEGALEDWRDQ